MMPVTTQLVRFGVFELDLASGELCKNGRRLKLQEQPFRLLKLLLEHPGQAVTRDSLKEALWPADTFVDFDHSLNAAIAKLRLALGDSAENPRFIETLARRGYRFIAPAEFVGSNGNGNAVQEVAENLPSQAAPPTENERIAPPSGVKRKAWLVVYTTAAVVLVTFALWLCYRSRSGETELVQLTEDTGLTTSPAVSPDGKLLAYASDRGSTGGLNIWVQQLGSGASSVQLTYDIDADEPTFSPDGSTIAFSSRRDGGGIYVIPVIGGEASRLTSSGRTPRFSPDGRWIAYCAGGSYAILPTVDLVGAIYVIPSSGGQSKRLGRDLTFAADPVWSPDSKHLLAYVAPQHGFVWDETDWWLLATDETPSKPTGDFRALQQQGVSLGFDRIPRLSEWTNHSITFAAGVGDTTNIWRAPVSSEGHITGLAKRLTSGTALETSATLTRGGELIFSSLNQSFAVWSLPIDPAHAKVTGQQQRITSGVSEILPSISIDGRLLAFTAARRKFRGGEPAALSEEAADLQVRIKDLSTGKETIISDATNALWHPQISRDGSMVAYTLNKPGWVYVASANGKFRRRIAGPKNMPGCLFAWDWSPDKRYVLFNLTDAKVHSVDVLSGREEVFLQRPDLELFQARFSPDDRSLALIGCYPNSSGGSQCRIFIVPIENGVPARANRWIALDHPSRWDDKPRWSPDGRLIYFVSDRDGYLCLWAQRVTNGPTALEGAPFPVHHLHNARLSMANVDPGILEIDVAKDKIVLGLGEVTGNIWSLKHRPASR